jgi:hypothetical protein
MLLFLIGIPLGILQSVFVWWLILRVFAPKMVWHSPSFVRPLGMEPSEPSQLTIRLKNQGSRRRGAIDVQLHADLRAVHPPSSDGVTKTVIRLPLNTQWMPSLRTEARIRVEAARIPSREWDRFGARTNYSERDIEAVLRNHADAYVRFFAVASDGLSGARLLFRTEQLRGDDLQPVATDTKEADSSIDLGLEGSSLDPIALPDNGPGSEADSPRHAEPVRAESIERRKRRSSRGTERLG